MYYKRGIGTKDEDMNGGWKVGCYAPTISYKKKINLMIPIFNIDICEWPNSIDKSTLLFSFEGVGGRPNNESTRENVSIDPNTTHA